MNINMFTFNFSVADYFKFIKDDIKDLRGYTVREKVEI